MSSNTPDLEKIKEAILQASSITTLMGFAALGAEYSGMDKMLAPSGVDYTNAAKVVSDLLANVCGEIEVLQAEAKEGA
jgi:hypothetical protein